MIKSITLQHIKLDLKKPFSTSFMTEYDAHRIIVILEDENANTGVGEIATLNIPIYKQGSDIYTNLALLERFIIPSIFKHQEKNQISTIEDLLESYSWIKGGNFCKSGIEMAFWDLLSEQQNKSIVDLFKGTRDFVECGSSVGAKTKKEVISRVNASVNAGFKRIKVKIWPSHDIEVIASIRKLHPNIPLQVDANSAYTLKDWKHLRKLDRFDMIMIEQPLSDNDIIDHALLSEKLDTPICLDESILSNQHVKSAISLWEKLGLKNKLIINIKPPRVGGYTESIKIAKTCAKHNIPAWVGGMLETQWGKYFNLCLNSREEFTLPGDHHGIGGSYFDKDIAYMPLTKNRGVYRFHKKPLFKNKNLDHLTIYKNQYTQRKQK